MDTLEDEEILVRDDDRDNVWRFRHDLLRDVAYESLAKRERQRLHLRLANRLAEPERADRYPRTAAHHLEQAARNALDLNPRDRTLAERAVRALAHAGDLARRQLESWAAVDLYDRALALAGPESGWGEREAWILSLRGESQYWLGEFASAEDSLLRALELDPASVLIRAHASRYLADISLTIRGDREKAEGLFEASLSASRELGNPAVLARTLLMAGWVPYWGNDLERARAMFLEALEVARSNPQTDAWAEARALVGLSSITSPVGDERESLRLGLEALEIGRASNDAFTTAVAHENVANSLRRLWKLDEAMEHAEEAIRTFRELGARWELASALGDRGIIHRLSRRPEEGEPDLREAFRICRDLGDRALISWTAAELARTLIAKGDVAECRRVLEDPNARLAIHDPASAASVLGAESLLALTEGDRKPRWPRRSKRWSWSGPRGGRIRSTRRSPGSASCSDPRSQGEKSSTSGLGKHCSATTGYRPSRNLGWFPPKLFEMLVRRYSEGRLIRPGTEGHMRLPPQRRSFSSHDRARRRVPVVRAAMSVVLVGLIVLVAPAQPAVSKDKVTKQELARAKSDSPRSTTRSRRSSDRSTRSRRRVRSLPSSWMPPTASLRMPKPSCSRSNPSWTR